MPRCAGYKPDGSSCERIVGASQSYCYSHDPARSDERRRSASKAGKSKPSKELHTIKGRLAALADGVLLGTIDKGDASVVSQIWNTYLRAVSVELKIKEATELEERLEALEAHLQGQKGGASRWG
jgi:hypothetical protein